MVLPYAAAITTLVVAGIAFLLFGKHLPNSRRWDRLIAVAIVVVLLSLLYLSVGKIAFSTVVELWSPRPIHPTYEHLKKRGFYVFVLPDREVDARGWEQEVALWSWTAHCGVLTGDTYNPLVVTYGDDVGDTMLKIQHGPWKMVWDHTETSAETHVPWESEWSSEGRITYYTRPAPSNIARHLYRFSDMHGYDVQIAGSLSVTETLRLIRDLEYVGRAVETLNDPWGCSNK
jgi:hypothetical protein